MIGLYVLVTHGLYIWLAVWSTKKVAHMATTRAGRIVGHVAAVGVIAIFMLIPIWDELLTLPTYYELCRTEAGVHIYGKMALPKEFYSKSGVPLFIHNNGDIDGYFNKRGRDDKTDLYKYVRFEGGEKFINTMPTPIKRYWDCVLDRANNRKLACNTLFSTTNGWWSKVFFTDFRGLMQTSSCSRISFKFARLQRRIFESAADESSQ